MITIWKYEIPIVDGNFTIPLPVDSKILSFQTQKEIPTLWCQVNTDLKLVKRVFKFYGTSYLMKKENNKYIGTIQIHNGDLVFHLFEVIKDNLMECKTCGHRYEWKNDPYENINDNAFIQLIPTFITEHERDIRLFICPKCSNVISDLDK